MGTVRTHIAAYGLNFSCALPLSGVPEERSALAADVDVGLGEVPESLGDHAKRGLKFEAVPGQLLLNTQTIARFLVRDGNCVRIAPRPGMDTVACTNLLFGWVTGGLLLQRERLALHAASISDGSGAIAFCGPSGVGKSTLISLLAERGFVVGDDNIAALDIDACKGALVQPGLGSIRLHKNSLSLLSGNAESSLPMDPHKSKFIFGLEQARRFRQAVPLRAVVVLHRAPRPGSRVMPVAQRMAALKDNTFMLRLAAGLGVQSMLFSHWMAIARRTVIESMAVPMDRGAPQFADDVAERLSKGWC